MPGSNSLIADPSQPVAILPLMSAAERKKVLVDFNETAAEYPFDATIHQLFERQAKQTPKAVAFLFEKENLTYQELNTRANRLARNLVERGLAPGARVGVSMARSLEMAVGLLAILKAGGVYISFDPAYPPNRLTSMLKDAGIQFLLCDSAPPWAAMMDAPRPQVISSHEISSSNPGTNAENPNLPITPDDAAYIIYTSGSTGEPKAVVAPHRGAVNRFSWMWDKFPFGAGEVCCAKTSLNFVGSVWEMWGPLLRGVPTVLLPDDVVKNPQGMLQALSSQKITRLVLVPSLLRSLLDSCDDLAIYLPNLKYWMTGGEVLSFDLFQRFQQMLPGRILLNLYGSSEAAPVATCYDTRDNAGIARVPIGRPISNTQVYILDTAGQPVPIGVPGEMYVGGAGLASGYLNRPDLTAEKFVSNPFSNAPHARLYRTGDRARYLADGNIDFLGRMDDQVKVRGFRVELGEIESRLTQHPGVKRAAVMALDDNTSGKRIVAYVVPDTSYGPAQQAPMEKVEEAADGRARNLIPELRHFLAMSLPDYMLPSAFVALPSLPLLPNGKVDRRVLPAPSEVSAHGEVSYVAPRDPVERKMVQIWEKILNVKPVGVTQNFFDLGGHSLLAATVLRRVEKSFGKKLPLVALFQAPTVEGFSRIIRDSGWSAPPVIAVQPKGSKPPFFCIYDRFDYGNLKTQLGDDQPLYVLPFDGIFDQQMKRGFVDVAQEFVSRIRTVQPEGPYYLGGMCLGGRIAFAIASELYRQGDTVRMLAIIDSPAPGYLTAMGYTRHWKRRRFALVRWRILKGLTFRQKIDVIAEAIKQDAKRYNWRLRWRLRKELYRHLGKEIPVGKRDLFQLMRETMGDCCPPKPFPGKVTLFLPSRRTGDYSGDVDMGWRNARFGELEVHEIPGRHIELLRKPNVEVLGRILSESLRKAQAERLARVTEPSDDLVRE